jgi:hypothetical protein
MANMDHVGKVVGGIFGTILECMHGGQCAVENLDLH